MGKRSRIIYISVVENYISIVENYISIVENICMLVVENIISIFENIISIVENIISIIENIMLWLGILCPDLRIITLTVTGSSPPEGEDFKQRRSTNY